MKPRYLFLFIVFSILIQFSTNAQSGVYEEEMFDAINKILKEHHIDYDTLLERVSERLPELLLAEIDPGAKYITVNESEIIGDTWSSLDVNDPRIVNKLRELSSMFEQRLIATLDFLNNWEDVNFYEEDSIFFELNTAPLHFAKTQESLELYWIHRLKYQVLNSYKGDSILEGLSTMKVNQFLNDKVKSIVESEKCVIQSLMSEEKLKTYLLEAVLNAFCLSFDPHSVYLSPQSRERLLSGLSSEVYSTGITFAIRGSRYFVSDISTFSDAANHEGIKTGDEIVGWVKGGVFQSLSCLTMNELNDLFYGVRESILILEIKSGLDHIHRRFQLSKSLNSQSVNHTFSYVLSQADTQIGYVQFPRFYAQYNADSRSSSQDLAFILLEMKKKDVRDVIIDLRNNGGGSIHEASEILKYFTDYGPLFSIVSKEENGKPMLEKDMKRGKLVNGKIIFLVNAISASASELVAATMQKYPNSLIVGSTTFGKATGQIMVPVETRNDDKGKGMVVVTSLRMYRIDGYSYQGEGVYPDIELPTFMSKTLASESNLAYPLVSSKVRHFREVAHRAEPITQLKDLSEKRGALKKLDSLSQLFDKKIKEERYVSIQYDAFKNDFIERNMKEVAAKNMNVASLEKNEAFLTESTQLKKYLEQDAILQEVFQIFIDWKELTENQ